MKINYFACEGRVFSTETLTYQPLMRGYFDFERLLTYQPVMRGY